jgi:RHS repeat-associated protein
MIFATSPSRFRSSVDSGLGGVTKRNHYSADVDSPVWTDEGDGTYSRIVSGIMGPAGVIAGVGGALTWLIANQQGTFVAGMAAGSTGLTYTSEYTENGLPRNSADAGSRRYGWLGTAQRAADTPGGLTQMGARLYAPGSGRFLSVYPVYGGSANSYEYCFGDSTNCTDLSGEGNRSGLVCYWWSVTAQCTVYLNEYQTDVLIATLFWGAAVATACAFAGAASWITIVSMAVGSVCTGIAISAGVVATTLYLIDAIGGHVGIYFRVYFWRTKWWWWGWHYGRWRFGGGYVWHQ